MTMAEASLYFPFKLTVIIYPIINVKGTHKHVFN